MFIFTSSALDPLAGPPKLEGVRVLVLDPKDKIWTGNLNGERDLIVAEYLQPIRSISGLFGDLSKWLRLHLDRNDVPIIYVDRPVDSVLLAHLADRGRAEAQRLYSEFSEDGRLILLLIGEAIACNPLLPVFLEFLQDRDLSDQTFIALLSETFEAV